MPVATRSVDDSEEAAKIPHRRKIAPPSGWGPLTLHGAQAALSATLPVSGRWHGLSEAAAQSEARPVSGPTGGLSQREARMKLRLLGFVSILTALLETAGAGWKG